MIYHDMAPTRLAFTFLGQHHRMQTMQCLLSWQSGLVALVKLAEQILSPPRMEGSTLQRFDHVILMATMHKKHAMNAHEMALLASDFVDF